jgi:hypothetical protein
MANTEFELASVNGLPEFKVVIDDRGVFPIPIVKTRTTILKTFVCIERTENINEETLKAFAECILFAGASAAFAGCVPGGILAVPTFMQTFGVHATSKGLELVASQINFRTETIYGEWE